jgi:predicted phosphodiesterase
MIIGLSVIQNLYLIVFYNGEIMNVKNDLIIKYLDQFPNIGILTLAKKIFNENKLKYKDVENVRSQIRYLKGSKGSNHLKSLSTDKYLLPENRERKYNLPPSIETEYEPYKIIGNKGLIFSDLHLPFYSKSAVECMFDYTKNMNLDFIIMNGDILDMFEVSQFIKEPNLCSLKDEITYGKQFMDTMNEVYPKAAKFYKFGNHEKRLEDYLKIKAPELFSFDEFRLEILLDLFNKNIKYIPEDKYIDLNNTLYILHGHESRNGITSPANPARTAFLRNKDCTVVGHYHQSSSHTEPTINGKIITCYSLGALCELHPKYLSQNRWNHGFGIYEKHDDNFWTFSNRQIIKGRVV